ncbi:PTS transporter subunit EIIC [Amphibacillus sp. Q70]|uniref:PTS transporter subunit EIIC n=1 Tax=Amphibacillus sp. Q70 TaxID=3453416 RepID=UPI003F8540C6
MNKEEKNGSVIFATIQKIGRSFFLPVSILPIAGLLLGIGSALTNQGTIEAYNLEGLLGNGTVLHVLFSIFSQVGNAIFGNLPIIFAISVAIGMAKQEKAVSALSAAISFFVMHTTINALLQADGSILADGSLGSDVLDGAITSVVGISSLEMGVFGGIAVGLGVAALHNRFYKQELPSALSFFAGVRFVPIISVLTYIFVGVAFYFIWPLIQSAIFSAGGLVTESGYFGTFIFGFMERALIPFGLHHVFYIPFWQTALGGTAIIDGVTIAGAQNIYFAELASPNTIKFSVDACRFMTGKYSFMMAGLPAAAYAMYKVAKPENRKLVGGLLFSAALTSFLTGITEPIEFTFLFIAPFLFIIHCVFAGISFVLMHLLNICIGTTFSCGLIDFLLYGPLQGNAKTNWLMITFVFIGYAILYFFVFKFLIEKFNIPTPGRENSGETKLYTKDDFKNKNLPSENTEDELSNVILKAIGGIDNLVDIDACATRLRLTVNNPDKVDEELLKQNGARGIIKKGLGIQIIYGPQVSIIKSNFEEFVEQVS